MCKCQNVSSTYVRTYINVHIWITRLFAVLDKRNQFSTSLISCCFRYHFEGHCEHPDDGLTLIVWVKPLVNTLRFVFVWIRNQELLCTTHTNKYACLYWTLDTRPSFIKCLISYPMMFAGQTSIKVSIRTGTQGNIIFDVYASYVQCP